MKKLFLVFALLALFAVPFAAAQADDLKDFRGNALRARLSYLQCRVAFTVSQLDSIAASDANATQMTSLKASLENDVAVLAGYAANASVKEFDSYVRSSLAPHAREAVRALSFFKRSLAGKNNTALRKKLRADFQEAQKAFAACESEKQAAYARNRIDYYRKWANDWSNTVSRLSAKGFDVSQLQAVVDDLQSQVIAPLQAAIESGNASEIMAAVQDARNKHLHLWARFEVALIRAHLQQLEPIAEKYRLQEMVGSVNSKVASASALAVPGRVYAEGEFQEVWSYLKDAADDLKALAKAIRGNASTIASPSTNPLNESAGNAS
ncbi:MAG: hypothetical protein ACP5O3_02265 [Candidatus Micrarchaeia archaeon]